MMENILTIDEYYKTEKLTPHFVSEIKEFEAVVYEMVKVMNEIHNTNYSYRFWKLLLLEYINIKLQKREYLSPNLVVNRFSIKQKLVPLIVYLIRALKNSGSYKKIKDALKNQDTITFGFHETETISKEVGASLPTHFPIILSKGDSSKRAEAYAIADRYNDLFYKNIIRGLPIIFVEHLQYQYDSIKLYDPGQKVFHVSIILSDFMKLMIAKYVDKGSKLYIYQHGGGAGEVKDRANFHEASISDKFITWGWQIHETEIPHKAFRCNKFKKIYFSSSQVKKIDVFFAFNVLGDHAPYYKVFMKNLLKNLDPVKYRNLVARPRVTQKWKSAKAELDFIENKKVKIDTGKTQAADLAAKSKIVVCFTWWSPQTLFAECAFVNQPVVSFVREMDYTTIFKPYYDFFIEYKLYHESWESLANHLNNTDLNEWWAEVIRHPMYVSYKHTFVRE